MKKTLLIGIAMAFSTMSFAQKIEYQEAQTRVIEPMQDVYVRPMVADLDIIKKTRQTYGPTLFMANYKLVDILQSENALEQAKILATYEAAKQENADVIVGATYYVTHHVENGKVSEYGVEITVNGYPARYVNWHKMGEDANDKTWVPNLIEGQRARALVNSSKAADQKTEAVKGR